MVVVVEGSVIKFFRGCGSCKLLVVAHCGHIWVVVVCVVLLVIGCVVGCCCCSCYCWICYPQRAACYNKLLVGLVQQFLGGVGNGCNAGKKDILTQSFNSACFFFFAWHTHWASTM